MQTVEEAMVRICSCFSGDKKGPFTDSESREQRVGKQTSCAAAQMLESAESEDAETIREVAGAAYFGGADTVLEIRSASASE
jgi:hypothetical protein